MYNVAKIESVLDKYLDRLSESELKAAEEVIFGGKYTERQRIYIEQNRLSAYLLKNPDKLVDNLDLVNEVRRLVPLMDIDSSVIPDIKEALTKITILCDQNIRFTGSIKDLKDKIEEEKRKSTFVR